MATVLEQPTYPVVDTDSHVTEPPDLWTSRVSRKFVDMMPRVATDESGNPRWRVRDRWLNPPGYFAFTGWDEYPPNYAVRLEDVDPGSFDPHERLKRLDEYGIYAQVLYPNMIGFETIRFIELGKDASLEATRAYNDFLVDFASADPERLLPICMPPFWDLDEAVKEIKRCHRNGHRGILFGNKYELLGMPSFVDPYWDPIYQVATELGLPINFHIGFSQDTGVSERRGKEWLESYEARAVVRDQSTGMMISNATTIATLLTSHLPERLPDVKFVSVESGFGYLPYLLDSLDWHWRGYGIHEVSPELPSERFRRQCYGSFWFETTTLPLLSTYPDNFMFSTDYPHPTSLSPGPCSPALAPNEHIKAAFSRVPESIARKVLAANAARLYGVTLPY